MKVSLVRMRELDNIIKEHQSKSLNQERMSRSSANDDNENETRRLKLQVKQLLDENSFLRSDHEIIRKK